MAKGQKFEISNLDGLLNGKWPKGVVEQIKQVELRIEDVAKWEASKPPVRVHVEKDHVCIEMKLRVPLAQLKKALAVAAAGATWLGYHIAK